MTTELTAGRLKLLEAFGKLDAANEIATNKALAEACGWISPFSVAEKLAPLAANGLIERRQGSAKAARFTLTEKGRALLKALAERRAAAEGEGK